jgi:hypothetical protein
MSNFNASMDYRGINISNQGEFILPDPFDEINVKTLNIVDDSNNVLYTMPQEIPDLGGSVAVFEVDGSSSLKPYAPYPADPSCFGWFDCGTGTIAPNTTILPNTIIPSFIQTGGVPQYNSPISTSFVFNQATGIITCNEAGIYLIQQSYEIDSNPNPVIAAWGIGLYNRTSGRYYKGGSFTASPSVPTPRGGTVYSQTTYDTFTVGTELNIYGVNADPVNSIFFTNTFLTIFRIA